MATIFTPMFQRVSDWGYRRAAYWQLMHTLERLIGLRLNYVKVASGRDDLLDPEPPEIDPCFDCRMAAIEDLQPYVGQVEGLDQEFVNDAFARGDECVMTLHNEELVHFCFCSRGRTRVTPQLDVLIPEGFRYNYKEWTHRDYRRRNLAKHGTWFRKKHGRRPYNERSLSYVETHNYASLLRAPRHPNVRGIKMGFIGWFVIFGRQIPFTSRHARWIGFVLVRKDTTKVRQRTD